MHSPPCSVASGDGWRPAPRGVRKALGKGLGDRGPTDEEGTAGVQGHSPIGCRAKDAHGRHGPGTSHCWGGTGSVLCMEEDITLTHHRVQSAFCCWSPFPPGAWQGEGGSGSCRGYELTRGRGRPSQDAQAPSQALSHPT